MILSERDEFADATSVALAAGTHLIGDVLDLGLVRGTQGIGNDLYFVIQTDTEIITGGTAGTIQFQLASDAQAAIATDGSATVHLASASLVTDDAAANSPLLNAGGYIYAGRLPYGQNYERYLGVLAVVGTTTITAGKINAFLTPDLSAYRSYADNVPN